MITEQLHQDFSTVLSYYLQADADTLPTLQEWERNKKWLYQELFNNQLKISSPIKLHVTEPKKIDVKNKLIKQFSDYKEIFTSIDVDSLINNSLQSTIIINNKKYQKGMKVSKIFKQEVENVWDNIKLEKYYSQIVGMFKLTGNLVFSIDPIDFLTMSTNTYSWDSCHEITEGEFKGGPLSFLTDNCSIICYVEGAHDMEINKISVSNKKWRMMAHVSPDFPYVIFNSQYPMNNPLIMPIVLNYMVDLFNLQYPDYEFIFTTYHWPDFKRLIKDKDSDAIHFNDILVLDQNNSPRTNFVYSIVPETHAAIQKLPPILIGNYPLCVCCGADRITKKGTLLCQMCNPGEYCCTCGEHYHYDELVEIDEEMYCDSCFDNEFTYCDECDELIRRYHKQDHNCDLMTYVIVEGETINCTSKNLI